MTTFYPWRPASALDNRILPVTLDDLKDHLRVEHDEQDRLLLTKIHAAVNEVERYIEKALIVREFVMLLPAFPNTEDNETTGIEIPNPPLQAVTSIKYLDENETEQTVDPASYRLNQSGILPTIVPTTGNSWPATWDSTDAVRVTYTAGFATTQSEVPPALREAVILRAGTRFVMTEEAGLGASLWQLGDDAGVHALLAPFRLVTTV